MRITVCIGTHRVDGTAFQVSVADICREGATVYAAANEELPASAQLAALVACPLKTTRNLSRGTRVRSDGQSETKGVSCGKEPVDPLEPTSGRRAR